MKANLHLLFPVVLASMLTLGGCGHRMMHGSTPATEPLKANASAPIVLGTYN